MTAAHLTDCLRLATGLAQGIRGAAVAARASTRQQSSLQVWFGTSRHFELVQGRVYRAPSCLEAFYYAIR
jgi:hypothetical protein